MMGEHALAQSVNILEVMFTCTDVIEPFLVVVILSCMVPMSVARVGW